MHRYLPKSLTLAIAMDGGSCQMSPGQLGSAIPNRLCALLFHAVVLIYILLRKLHLEILKKNLRDN